MPFFIPLLIAGVGIAAIAALSPAGQKVIAGAGEVTEAAGDVAKATARAIESETEMLLPVVRDPIGREMQLTRLNDGQYVLPADGDYSILGAFDKLMSVPAHQAAFLALAMNKGTELAKEAIKYRGLVQIARVTGQTPILGQVPVTKTIDLTGADVT